MTTLFGRLRLHSISFPQWFLSTALVCLSAAGAFAAEGYPSDLRYRPSEGRDYGNDGYDVRYEDRIGYDRPVQGGRRYDERDEMGDVEYGGQAPRPLNLNRRPERDWEPRELSDPAMSRDGRFPEPSRYESRPSDYRSHLDSRESGRYQGGGYRSRPSESEYVDELPSARPGRAPARDMVPREGRYSPRYEEPVYEGSESRDPRDSGDFRPSEGRRPDFRRNRTGSGRHGAGRMEGYRTDEGRTDGGRYEGGRGARSDETLGVPGADDRRRYDRPPVNSRPIPSSRQPNPEDQLSDSQKRQMKITARYGNPLMQRFVQTTSAQQGVRLYQESLQLIDTRHLRPSAYDVRIREAMANLSTAVEDSGFQQANGVRLTAQHVEAFRNGMRQVAESRPVQSGADAVAMLQNMMDVAGRSAGIRPGAVTLEFMNGATDSLDKYSAFIPEEPAQRPSAAILDDHVVGIGVEIKPGEQGVLIKKVLPGGPAAEAGLRGGDVIVAVNGRDLTGKSLDYAVDLITGPVGSRLQLAVVRGGQNPATVNLVRRNVAVASVSDVQMLDRQAGLGYIKLEKFAKSSDEEMDKALWTLHQQGMQSLILDLRGNPGGLLDVCERLADKFLPSGTIVSTRGRTQADNTVAQAHREQTWKTPLVVMIDGDSASASEILAAAIQDNGRGVVVGRTSYGKGTVQTHFPLQTVSGYLKLTTAKFYAPSGREMAGQGVEPDLYVPDPQVPAGEELALQNDPDVVAAVRVARNPRTQELAGGGQRAR